ncbi:unnamed protein product [Polarella glacialis]|uniref:Uncharacterized protein n=1 Tax=Polarella glacialis TaxID=89957 RepID=A0A813JA86_POLGL|nr:unnamed protein product [Polarella glacialis]
MVSNRERFARTIYTGACSRDTACGCLRSRCRTPFIVMDVTCDMIEYLMKIHIAQNYFLTTIAGRHIILGTALDFDSEIKAATDCFDKEKTYELKKTYELNSDTLSDGTIVSRSIDVRMTKNFTALTPCTMKTRVFTLRERKYFRQIANPSSRPTTPFRGCRLTRRRTS